MIGVVQEAGLEEALVPGPLVVIVVTGLTLPVTEPDGVTLTEVPGLLESEDPEATVF